MHRVAILKETLHPDVQLPRLIRTGHDFEPALYPPVRNVERKQRVVRHRRVVELHQHSHRRIEDALTVELLSLLQQLAPHKSFQRRILADKFVIPVTQGRLGKSLFDCFPQMLTRSLHQIERISLSLLDGCITLVFRYSLRRDYPVSNLPVGQIACRTPSFTYSCGLNDSHNSNQIYCYDYKGNTIYALQPVIYSLPLSRAIIAC
jgi:hypothetical protein